MHAPAEGEVRRQDSESNACPINLRLLSASSQLWRALPLWCVRTSQWRSVNQHWDSRPHQYHFTKLRTLISTEADWHNATNGRGERRGMRLWMESEKMINRRGENGINAQILWLNWYTTERIVRRATTKQKFCNLPPTIFRSAICIILVSVAG